MFAGATREKVFSRPDVIRRVNAQFVPVALRAPLVNGMHKAGDPDETRVYARLKRAMLAPQGLGVLDSGGRVLAWVEMFDDDASVLAFLDLAQELYAKESGPAERYMKFPGNRVEDSKDPDGVAIVSTHERCPADSSGHTSARRGDLKMEVVGRALDEKGNLSADTVNQEHYAQDQFAIPREAEESLAGSLASGERVKVPDAFARPIVMHAYLGHIDVRPIDNPRHGETPLAKIEFWAQRGDGPWAKIEGTSETASKGREFTHAVKLAWQGALKLEGGRATELVLSARGTEELKWLDGMNSSGDEVSYLPAGRRIDMNCGVRYGVSGTLVSEDRAPVEPQAAQGREPDPDRIQEKIRRLQQGVRKLQEMGKDPSPIGRIMGRFQPLMQEGKAAEAEAVLDEALSALAAGPDTERPHASAKIQEKMANLHQALQKRMSRVEVFLQEGKIKEAEEALDELIRRLSEK